MARILVSTFIVAVEFSQPVTANLPECAMTQEKAVSFRHPGSVDVLSISIGPGPCHTAELAIRIRSEDGKLLYEYRAPFKQHTAVRWDDPKLDEVAESFVSHSLDGMDVASNLAESLLPEADMDQYEFLDMPESDYQALRKSDRPTYWHQTYYEGHKIVAFDPTTGKAIDVLHGGL